jgi:hypothetical protein
MLLDMLTYLSPYYFDSTFYLPPTHSNTTQCAYQQHKLAYQSLVFALSCLKISSLSRFILHQNSFSYCPVYLRVYKLT